MTYYRDRAVRVTADSIEVNGRAYPLGELARVWHRRGQRSWRALASVPEISLVATLEQAPLP